MKMKSVKTLCKDVENFNIKNFQEFLILDTVKEFYKDLDENSFKSNIAERDILCILVSIELAKALNVTSKKVGKTFKIVHDVNYIKSNRHKTQNYVYDEISLVSSDDSRALHFYVKANVKRQQVYFDICCSCKQTTALTFESHFDELQFIVKRDKNNRAKTSVRKKVDYNDIVNVSKVALSVLNDEYISVDSAESNAVAENSAE